jgi:hypothetical protein
MEYRISELRNMLRNTSEPMQVWAAGYYKRHAQNKCLRNTPPILVTVSRYLRHNRYGDSYEYRVTNSRGKEIPYEGTASGAELRFFSTQEEAINCYNQGLAESIDMINVLIVKLEQEKIKLESMRVGR